MSRRANPSTKDSGVEWLGQVPEHWEVSRAKNLFQLMSRPPREEDDIVTAFRDGTVTLRKNRRVEGFTNSVKEIGYQGIRAGDLVIHAMDGFAGAIGVSDSDGKSSPVYSACVPRKEGVLPSYYARLIRQMALNGFIASLGKGVRERSTEFRYRDFADLPLPVPPLAEQHAIAAFLDRETARLDTLIAKQERLIELSMEKRRALISHAVTRGLDASAPLKDSGVEWLGQVPEHWNVPPVYARFEVQLGKMLDTSRLTGKHLAPYLRNVDVQWDKINTEDLPQMDFDKADREKFSLKRGDLLICEGGEVGRAAIWNDALPECYYQKALHRIRPCRDDEPRFMYYLLLTTAQRGVFVAEGNSNTIDHLTAEKLRHHRLPFPPLSEQRAIVKYLDGETAKIDTLIAKARRSIELMKEHRASLIAAAVTGKIDVRGDAMRASGD